MMGFKYQFVLKLFGILHRFMIRKSVMSLAWVVVLIVLYNGYHSSGVGTNVTKRPEVVEIGSIFAFDTIIGKVAKFALEAAVEDVNSSPDILGGTMLKLTMHDTTNATSFLGIIEGKPFLLSSNTI